MMKTGHLILSGICGQAPVNSGFTISTETVDFLYFKWLVKVDGYATMVPA